MLNPYGEIEIHNKGNRDHLFMPDKKDYVLMQFTGLLDKNGKEVWEGDVLKLNGKFIINEPVEYVEGMASYSFTPLIMFNPQYKTMETVEPNTLEVIGNVHANPELIKNHDS